MEDRVINAAGKMTMLGASAVDDKVADAVYKAAKEYFVMDELNQRVSEMIVKKTKAENGMPTSSASAGIALAVAGVVCEKTLASVEALPFIETPKKIILQKSHAVNFGAPITQLIKLGGGIPIEVGSANKISKEHIESAINHEIGALLFVQSHYTAGAQQISLEKCIEIAHKNEIPIIVDAAAEENLEKFIELGVDLVIYSGSKAIGAPTSGFIAGRKELIEKCRLNNYGIGRPMKIGKEALLGLYTALENYPDSVKTIEEQKALLLPIKYVVDNLPTESGVTFALQSDEAGRAILRGKISFSKNGKYSISDFINWLETGEIRVFTRKHTAQLGYLQIDPRTLIKDDNQQIAKKMTAFFKQY